MERKEFVDRLVQLRMQKDVSAREMSLAMGQSPSYINNIETGVNYPSMQTFFFMCEYLGITPQEFFDFETKSPGKVKELNEAVKGLSEDHLDTLIKLAKGLQGK